jgi:hypothetical protein
MPIKSIEEYIGYFPFVEKPVKFRHVSGYKQSATIDLINALDILIQKYGPRANLNAHPMRVLILDAASTHLSDELHQWCLNRPDPSDPIIHRNVSAPYKHQQNLIETYINHEKNLTRTNLAYNYAPDFLWFKALRYTIVTINLTLLPDTSVTRQEAMTGIKPDVSHYVPFYATGYALAPKELINELVNLETINTSNDEAQPIVELHI